MTSKQSNTILLETLRIQGEKREKREETRRQIYIVLCKREKRECIYTSK